MITYGVLAAVVALVCCALVVISWRRRRRTPAAAALAATMLANAVWCALDAGAALGAQLPSTLAYLILIAAVHTLTAATLCLNLMVSDPQWRLRRRTVLLLLTVPLLTLAAVATSGQHGLFFDTRGGRESFPSAHLGPLFWVHTAYCYALLGRGLSRLVRAWRRGDPVFRRQYATLVVAEATPTLALLAGALSGRVSAGTDLTPFGFACTGLLIAYALFRQGMLQLVPVARARIVDTLRDGVFVIDTAGRLIDVNTAGRALLARVRPQLPADVVGRTARELLREPDLLADLREGGQAVHELLPGLHVVVQVSRHLDGRGRLLATVVTTRDVSTHVMVERSLREHVSTIEALRERLQEEALRDALTGLHNRRHASAAQYAIATTLLQGQDNWTIPLVVQGFSTQHGNDYGPLNAFIIMSAVPVLIVYLLFQRYFVQGAFAGAVKG